MIVFKRIVYALGLIFTLSVAFSAQKQAQGGEVIVPKVYKAPAMDYSFELKNLVITIANEMASDSAPKPLKGADFAFTVIDLSDSQKWRWAEFRGDEKMYPASVVKLFYLAALERQLEDGKVTMTPELSRGVRDMIVDSSNEATQYILDVITETSSGAELPPKQFDIWQAKRNRVNRYYASMGYTNINVNQKTFCEDAYGIEQQSRNYKGENRNALTTNAVARLLAEIVTGRMNTPERTAAMMMLLSRDWSKPSTDTDNQAVGFTGKLLIDRKMNGTKLWSKAGWTSKARHDAAYIETTDGLKFVLVIFTENHANDHDIIPTIAGKVLDGLRGLKK